MKTLIAAVIAGLVLLAAPVHAQSASGKIAVVDFERVVRDSPTGKKAMAAAVKALSTRTAELQKAEAAIKADITRVNSNINTMSPEQREAALARIEAAKRDHDIEVRRLEGDKREREDQARAEVFRAASTAAATVRKQGGYDVILDSSLVFDFNPALDVTSAVIAAMPK